MTRVECLEGAHWLLMPAEGAPDHWDVYNSAERFVDWLNGLGAILSSEYERVSLAGSLFGRDASGFITASVVMPGSATLRLRGGRPTISINGQPLAEPLKGVAGRLHALGTASPAVNDALLLAGRERPTWSELFVAYELVKCNGGSKMTQCGWVADSEVAAFKHTANSYTALGIWGRHGKDVCQPPKRPMGHQQAIELIRRLVRLWSESLLLQQRA